MVPGFEVALGNVEAEASLGVQALGVGGRRYLGLGLFVPRRLARASAGLRESPAQRMNT